MKKQILIGLALLAVVVFFVLLGRSDNGPLGQIAPGTTTTFSSSSVSTTVQTVLSANSGAQYRSITNKLPGIQTWWICGPTSTGFIAGTGNLLSASTSPAYEMTEEMGSMWCTDTIFAITAAGTSSIATQER